MPVSARGVTEEKSVDWQPRLVQAVHMNELKRSNAELRVLVRTLQQKIDRLEQQHHDQLHEVREEERRHLGREIHDGVCSQLCAISLMTASLARKLSSGKSVDPGDIEQISLLVNESNEDLRRLSHGMNYPKSLELLGFSEALGSMAERISRHQAIVCTYEEDGSAAVLDQRTAHHLYRIALEALTNAAKHAEADRVAIRLETREENFVLTVEDNGKGFEEGIVGEGLGLASMNERIRSLGGRLSVEPIRSGGTRVYCVAPQNSHRR